MLAKDRREKNSAKCYFEAARFRVRHKHRSTRKQRLRHESERGALVRGSDTPSGHSVHKTAGDTWRAPARRLIQTHLGAELLCRVGNRRQRMSIPLRWQKLDHFSGLGEERRTPKMSVVGLILTRQGLFIRRILVSV